MTNDQQTLRRIFLSLLSFLLLCSSSLAQPLDKTEERKAGWTYQTHQHETLSEISIRLYGTHRLWPEIARWNALTPPYRLRPNQILVLKRKPTVESKLGERFVQNLWNAYFERRAKNKGETEVELKEQFLAATQKVEPSSDRDAEEYLSEGESLLKEEQFEKAVERFRKSRETNSTLTAPWFYEIRAFRLLNRDDEARKTGLLLLKIHPEFRELPLFKDLFKTAVGAP